MHSDLKLFVVLLHLGQFVRRLFLQRVQLVLQPAAVDALLCHVPGQRCQSHGCTAEVRGRRRWMAPRRLKVISACCERHSQDSLLRLIFRSFSVSRCCSGTSSDSFRCQVCDGDAEQVPDYSLSEVWCGVEPNKVSTSNSS